jgi:hypothetical protein
MQMCMASLEKELIYSNNNLFICFIYNYIDIKKKIEIGDLFEFSSNTQKISFVLSYQQSLFFSSKKKRERTKKIESIDR